jgi:uncharacterized protein
MPTRTPVTFTSRQGLTLFGILETPRARPDPNGLVVLLLSPGVKMRVGPQCLYRHMADTFLALGLSVFRFDCHGLGDSQGELPEALLRDVYNHIEVGRFVDDTIDAMDWMERTYGTRRFVASGLCGGAVTGLLAGERDARIVGLLGLGLTVSLASKAADASRYMTTGQIEDMQRLYATRLFNPQAWYRLLTLKADYRLIWRMATHSVRKRLAPPAAVVPTAPRPADDNANPLVPPAVFSMLSSKRPLLLVFGGSDRLQWEYEEKFVARHQERLAALPALCDVHVVKLANHVLSTAAWQQEMLDVSVAWLRRRFEHDVQREAATPALA